MLTTLTAGRRRRHCCLTSTRGLTAPSVDELRTTSNPSRRRVRRRRTSPTASTMSSTHDSTSTTPRSRVQPLPHRRPQTLRSWRRRARRASGTVMEVSLIRRSNECCTTTATASLQSRTSRAQPAVLVSSHRPRRRRRRHWLRAPAESRPRRRLECRSRNLFSGCCRRSEVGRRSRQRHSLTYARRRRGRQTAATPSGRLTRGVLPSSCRANLPRSRATTTGRLTRRPTSV